MFGMLALLAGAAPALALPTRVWPRAFATMSEMSGKFDELESMKRQLAEAVENERYTFAGVGVTHFEFNPHGRVAMYRVFDSDPMLLPASADQSWTWRNGETQDVATGLKCTSMTGPQIGDSLHNATVTTHAWTYEMPAAARAV